jgi:DNA invertase Pin-like site-specific DNA recombinase
MRVYGYVRVSTDEQANSRAGLDAQRAAILIEAQRQGWELIEIVEDAASGKSMKRPGIERVLTELRAGHATALVVAKLDRLSRSMLDFASLMATAQRQGWGVVALDVNVDTTTPSGEMMATVTAAFAQFERRLISQRTKEALAQRKAAGVRLGRERVVSAELEARAHALKASGLSVRKIGAALAVEGHHAPGGGDWSPSSLQRILSRVPA